ncbi:hypothetical protein F4677DRAFT_73688 [Hypoxylon crocopeplum]|nr:hypothetical protein F4677DRAFT_73688 [Hypoxylon crocopeplum]
MKVLHSTIAGLALLVSTAWALPQDGTVPVTVTDTDTVVPVGYPTDSHTEDPTITTTTTTVSSPTPEPPPTTTTTDSTSSFTPRCDYRYCDNGRDVCFYWAGYTSWDVSRGPIPGEVPTILGTCTDPV